MRIYTLFLDRFELSATIKELLLALLVTFAVFGVAAVVRFLFHWIRWKRNRKK